MTKSNGNVKQVFEGLAKNGTWQSRYDGVNFHTYNFFTRRNTVRRILQQDRFSSTLDLGCGMGDYYETLCGLTDKYIGLDFSQTMINQANSKYGGFVPKPAFIVGAAEAIPFANESFDLVCAIGFIEYFHDPNIPMREIIRVMKPGGTLVIQSFQIDLYRKMFKTFGLEFVKRALKSLFFHVLHRKPSIQYTDRPYTERDLDSLMNSFGLEKMCSRYDHFTVLPRVICKMLPKLYILSSEKISRGNYNHFSSFAVNYIGRFTLPKDATKKKSGE